MAVCQKNLNKNQHNFHQNQLFLSTCLMVLYLLSKKKNYVNQSIATFQIAKIDTTIANLKSQLLQKGDIVSELNLKKSKSFYASLNADDMPFFRFRLVFSKRGFILPFSLIFLLFFSIIPQYIFALGSKNSNYDNIYSKQMTQLILKDFQNMKEDCIDNYQLKYPNRVNELQLFKSNPFNERLEVHNTGVRTDLDLFSYFQGIKNEQNISKQ